MTEKRFTYMEQFNGFCDVYDNGKILSCMRLEYVENTVNLLNELNDENQDLKGQVGNDFNEANSMTVKIAELTEENEQLKTFLKKNCPMCRCNLKLFYEESKQRGDLDD